MPRTVSRSVRYVFAAFAGALLLLAGVQSFGHTQPRMGLSSCGWDDNPCVIEGVVVKAAPTARAEPKPIPAAQAVVQPAQHLHSARPSTPTAES
jgi:hypothetical protein